MPFLATIVLDPTLLQVVVAKMHAVRVLRVCWVHKSAIEKYCWLQIHDLHYVVVIIVVVHAVFWRMPMSCKTRSAQTQSHLFLDHTVPCATRQCVLHK